MQTPQGAPASEHVDGAVPSSSAGYVWIRRLLTLVYIVLTFQLGIILLRIPWKSAWTENNLLSAYPTAQHWFGSYFVRGAATGLGLLNLWIGVRETSKLLRSSRVPR